MSVIKKAVLPRRLLVKKVLCITLSRFINQEIDFLKMDIEGSEDGVILELSKRQRLRLIKEMVVEYHHNIANKSPKLAKFLKYFEDNGFDYSISNSLGSPRFKKQYQNILIYAYKN